MKHTFSTHGIVSPAMHRALREIQERLSRNPPGFLLWPIDVAGPDVARDIAAFFSAEGKTVHIVEPRDDADAWANLVVRLVETVPRQPGTDVGLQDPNRLLVFIGMAEPPESVHAGLRLLNQRRETLIKRLDCPVLWCGPISFLNLCWEEAPDFWSIRVNDYRLVADDFSSPTDALSGLTLDVINGNPEDLLLMLEKNRIHGHAVAVAAALGRWLASTKLTPYQRARAALEMARLLENEGDVGQAADNYRQALDAALLCNDLEIEARANVGIARLDVLEGRRDKAREALQRSREIANQLAEPSLSAAVLAAEALLEIGARDVLRGRQKMAEAKKVAAQESSDSTIFPPKPLDVLILTALPDELDGVLAVGDGGRAEWRASRDLVDFPYYRRVFSSDRHGRIEVAAAWIGAMGESGAVVRTQALIAELEPRCIAMTGACLGNPRKDLSSGDVVIVDRLYRRDSTVPTVRGAAVLNVPELMTLDLKPMWKADLASLKNTIDVRPIEALRPPSRQAQIRWILRTIEAHESGHGPAVTAHPDRVRQCPSYTNLVQTLLHDGRIVLRGRTLVLTEQGRAELDKESVLYPDGIPPEKPLQVHFGAMVTGNVTLRTSELFESLEQTGKDVWAADMDGVVLGELAERLDQRAIVVKSVSKVAGGDDDDDLRIFAARASAEFLLEFLQQHFDPQDALVEPVLSDWREEHDPRRAFLSRVECITKLRHPRATLRSFRAIEPFAGIIEVVRREGSLETFDVVGAIESPISMELVTKYIREVEYRFRAENTYLGSLLVHEGASAPADLARMAYHRGVRLTSFAEYQELIDFSRYLAWQTEWLEKDPAYPPWLYVDQPAKVSFAAFREEQSTDSAFEALWELLESPQSRFALVLGDFGAGKTFLMHELARRMARRKHPLVPVLVQMDKLDKALSFRALMAQHFAESEGGGPFDSEAFQYMLSEGKIALLFDGFDELASRMTYDRVVEHFETILQAGQGQAKVIVTSRRQHFLTDEDARRALTKDAENKPGYKLFLLKPFGEVQISRFLKNFISDHNQAEERYQLLREIRDLFGLAENPRLLAFIARIPAQDLRAARDGGGFTAAKLYRILVDRWLDLEYDRQNPKGSPPGISRESLRVAMTELALFLWKRGTKSFELSEIPGSLVRAMQPQDGTHLEKGIVVYTLGARSLFVRDAFGKFQFVHSSVLEWLVADVAAEALNGCRDSDGFFVNEWTALMVDFFLDMAERQVAMAWAWAKSRQPEDTPVKKNAIFILKRMERRWGRIWVDDERADNLNFEGSVERASAALHFEGHEFRGKDLSQVQWNDANLDRADLREATLVRAKLARASLVQARLARADLREADLSRANLHAADMEFASLVGADLSLAQFSSDTRLVGVNLLATKGFPAELIDKVTESNGVPPQPRRATPSIATDGAVAVQNVKFTRDGRFIGYQPSHSAIELWDLETCTLIREATAQSHAWVETTVAFSAPIPTAPNLARTIDKWFSPTIINMLQRKKLELDITCAAILPDQSRIVVGMSDGSLGIWEHASSEKLLELEGHTGRVTCVAWSPESARIASGAADGTVRLWDAATGNCLAVMFSHPNGWVCFTREGRYKCVGDIGGLFWHQIGHWRFQPGELDAYLPLRVEDNDSLLG